MKYYLLFYLVIVVLITGCATHIDEYEKCSSEEIKLVISSSSEDMPLLNNCWKNNIDGYKFISVSYGAGRDCEAGCFYNHKYFVIAKNNTVKTLPVSLLSPDKIINNYFKDNFYEFNYSYPISDISLISVRKIIEKDEKLMFEYLLIEDYSGSVFLKEDGEIEFENIKRQIIGYNESLELAMKLFAEHSYDTSNIGTLQYIAGTKYPNCYNFVKRKQYNKRTTGSVAVCDKETIHWKEFEALT